MFHKTKYISGSPTPRVTFGGLVKLVQVPTLKENGSCLEAAIFYFDLTQKLVFEGLSFEKLEILKMIPTHNTKSHHPRLSMVKAGQ